MKMQGQLFYLLGVTTVGAIQKYAWIYEIGG